MTGKDKISLDTSEIGTTASNDAMYLVDDSRQSFDRLRTGNNIEKGTAHLIEVHFPNYEVFWWNYLEPLRGKDGKRDWRYDTFQALEEIAMSQYGILKSLFFIDVSRPNITAGDGLQRFKNIYIHFGLILDLVDNFCRNICIVKEKLNLIVLSPDLRLSKEELLEKFTEWVDNEYNRCYDNMVNLGIPINYRPHSNSQYLELLIPDESIKTYKKYRTYADSIRQRRNFYTHNTGVDITIINPLGPLYVVVERQLKNYRNWSKIQKYILNSPKDFCNAKEKVEDDLSMMLRHLNSLWKIFIMHMDEIARHTKYKSLLYYDREAQTR